MTCAWCRATSSATRGRFCSQKCRQTAFRLRRRQTTDDAQASPGSFAYADPPYPKLAAKYYKHEPTYGGEVDHAELIGRLELQRVAGDLQGWALSTSARSLRDVLPLCPPDVRVCAWMKANGPSPLTFGIHNLWEPVLVVGGRQRRPGVRDYLYAKPARGGGTLPGRKPIAFAAWLFDLLGLQRGDELEDMFPGTGVIGTAWRELGGLPPSSVAGAQLRFTSLLQRDDAASPLEDCDAPGLDDASPVDAASFSDRHDTRS